MINPDAQWRRVGVCIHCDCGGTIWWNEDQGQYKFSGIEGCLCQIKGDNMEPRFYYMRDKENKPRVTVCLIRANGDIARGIAICSLSDNPHKATGRTIAEDRAFKAWQKRNNFDEISRGKAFMALSAVSADEFMLEPKCAFNPELTEFEQRILR